MQLIFLPGHNQLKKVLFYGGLACCLLGGDIADKREVAIMEKPGGAIAYLHCPQPYTGTACVLPQPDYVLMTSPSYYF
jgi:hypothetical protein